MFIRSELQELILDVLNEYLPKTVKKAEKVESAQEIIIAMEEAGLEVEEDPFEDDEEEEDVSNYVDFTDRDSD